MNIESVQYVSDRVVDVVVDGMDVKNVSLDAIATIPEAVRAWIAAGNVPTPSTLVPEKSVIIAGLVRFTVLTGVLTTTTDTIGVDAVTRLSAGRYRIFYSAPDDDLLILPAPIIRDAADLRIRVCAKNSTYTELKTVNAAGVAADAAEVTVMMSKVI